MAPVELNGTAHYSEELLNELLNPISGLENETTKSMYNNTHDNVQRMRELFQNLNETIYSSYMFDFATDFKNNYVDDLNSRLTYDVTRNLGHFKLLTSKLMLNLTKLGDLVNKEKAELEDLKNNTDTFHIIDLSGALTIMEAITLTINRLNHSIYVQQSRFVLSIESFFIRTNLYISK